MKQLNRVFATLCLLITVTVSVSAGDIQTPPIAPPNPPATATAAPGNSAAEPVSGESEGIAAEITEIVLTLLTETLSLL